MGNTLCKESNSSLRPGRVLDNVGSLMCPNGIGKSKTGINKTYLSRHVLETGTKSSTLNSWNSDALAVPDGTVIDRPPMAPPRKKRGNTLERGTVSPETLKVKNGFKDCFGPDSRRPSGETAAVKSQDTVDEAVQGKSGFEIDAKHDAFSDFSKVPTKTELEKPTKTTNDKGAMKVCSVGNRKSDKFFGENLSDSLSIEPMVKERRRSSKKEMEDLDKIDMFIEKNVLNNPTMVTSSKEVPRIEITKPEIETNRKQRTLPDEKTTVHIDELDVLEAIQNEETQAELVKYIDKSMGSETNLGKKAEFLMAMLEDYPEDRYLGMSPVEEPVIVPRRRKSRHICDDDKHMHGMLHKHDTENEPSKQLITTEASIENPPRKPSRDFSKYLAAAEGCSDSDDSCFSSPIRKHRPPNRKTLPSPPSPPKLMKSMSESHFHNAVSESSTPKKTNSEEIPKVHTPRTLKRIISMPSTASMMRQDSRSTTPQPVLLKSNSSSSFLIKDLQKAHISVGSFTPEDHARNHHDELVKPKHSLAVRKISIKSVDSTPTPQEEIAPPKFTIGSMEVVKSSQPPAIPKRRKSSTAELKQESMVVDPVSLKKPLLKETLKYDLGSFLESSRVLQHHDISNVIENVYNATDSKENILKDFQQYLEDQINAEINDANSKNPNSAKLLELLIGRTADGEDKLEDVKIDLVSAENSNKSSDIDECFDSEFEKIEKRHVKGGDLLEVPHRTSRRGSTDDVSEWFESGSEVESVVEESDKLGNMVSVKSSGQRLGRRESIEDVDCWFSKHNELSEGEEIIGVRKQRRGSDGFVAYDTSRQYPFGVVQHRRDSLSADMFEDITKLHDLGVSKDKSSTPLVLGKDSRLQERRGSDGLVFYDTSRKFPFGEPNTELPKILLGEQDLNQNGNDQTDKCKLTKDSEKPDQNANSSEHSTLLKFLSKENLI